jgi:hypothetical protein
METTALTALVEYLDRDEPAWRDRLSLQAAYPPYRSQADLDAIRAECRWLASQHPFGLAALEARASYVVGTGHTYTLRAKPREDVSPQWIEAAQREIVEFTERNAWFFRQRDNQWRLDRDGELLLRLFDVDGYLVVRYIEPELVSTPDGQRALLGLELDPQDAERVTAYWVRRPDLGGQYERVPADQVQHRRSTLDTALPRGLPVLFPVRDNLRRVWKLLRNMTTVAGIQAAVAMVRTHQAASAGSIQQYLSRMQATPAASGTAAGSSAPRPGDYETLPPGAILDLAPGVSAEFPSQAINVQNFVAAVQAELRAIAARLSMPEYMLSGDASNANYSSTLVAEGPAVRTFERLQSEMIWFDTALLARALRLAEQYGRLPAGLTDRLLIDAEAPTAASRNRLAEAQADQILLTMGLVSKHTLAARYGFDWTQEQALLQSEDE